MKIKNIKLFVDCHSFDNEFQGTRTFIKEVYLELLKQTNEIECYFGAVNTDILKEEFKNTKGCHFIKYNSSSSLYRLLIEIPLLIKKHKIDLAHFQYITPFIKNCKYIVTTHDILFNDFKSEFSFQYRVLRNYLFKRSITTAEIKTTVSNYSANRIQAHYHIDQKSISIIPNGVSNLFFEPYNKQNAKKHIQQKFNIDNFILYISRIEPRKNHLSLLNTYLSLELYKKNIALVFIGKTSIISPALNNKIEELPTEIKKHIYHIEQVNNDDLIEFYRASLVFVYPSKAEGFGIPPLEAGALKIPVICSNKTAMSDFTFFKKNNYNPENEEELIQKLNQILCSDKDNNFYEDIVSQIKKKYSWQSSAQQLLLLIKKEFKLS